jgi:uncharacterized protein YcaQ
VLFGDKFIARFEPGWDKKTNTFIIKNWWWEPGVKCSQRMKEELNKCFKQFAEFLDAKVIKIEDSVIEISELEFLE